MGFKKPDLAEIRKLHEQFQSSRSNQIDYRWASLPEKGEIIKVRFLPPVGDMNLPFFRIWKHYQVPSPEQTNETLNFTCLRTWNIECPICNKIDELKRKFGEELVSQWIPAIRGFFNVIIKDDPNYTPNLPYILGMPKSGLVWFLEVMSDNDYGDITDPFTGFWIKISRMENNQLRFDIIPKPTPIASSEEELNQIADQCFDLTKIWRQPDDEYYNTAKKIADKIEVIVKEKAGFLEGKSIIENPTQPQSIQSNQQDQTSLETPQNLAIITTEQPNSQPAKPNISAPPGAPDCFGSFDEKDSRCMICIYEIECRQASGG
jgi:hypothetical protein